MDLANIPEWQAVDTLNLLPGKRNNKFSSLRHIQELHLPVFPSYGKTNYFDITMVAPIIHG
jgi:hypothetical protein